MAIILYVGMDVHKESFTLCTYKLGDDQVKNAVKIEPVAKYVQNYLTTVRKEYAEEVKFVCGYEAGCLGYSLYHELSKLGIECVIMAPSRIGRVDGTKKIKTDKRDAANLAKALAYNSYKSVSVPDDEDDATKEFIRMRDNTSVSLKQIKQQILAFCLRHGLKYDGTKDNWTQQHIEWLHALKLGAGLQMTMTELLLELDHLIDTLKRLDQKIEELGQKPRYQAGVKKLSCFIGIKTHTSLGLMSEVGDFNRFGKAKSFAAFLGLVPGEDSSSESVHRMPITKSGNSHLRRLLIESANGYSHGKIGYKSAELRRRQENCDPFVVAYADKANIRLRQKYYNMTLHERKSGNVSKVAVARELACFIWGMMTEHYDHVTEEAQRC